MSIRTILTADYFRSGTDSGRASWAEDLAEEFGSPYMRFLRKFLCLEEEAGRTIYPECSEIFRAFDATPLTEVKVVIIGQDPYYNGAADGLAFSMKPETIWPNNNSLKKIFSVVRQNGYQAPSEPCSLLPWANQGILLLNPVLTVREGCADSHKCQGWEKFTDKVVEIVNDKQCFVVFLLWGDQAKNKRLLIDCEKHKILEASHPMKHGGNFSSIRHFSEVNSCLQEKRLPCIDWSLTCLPIA